MVCCLWLDFFQEVSLKITDIRLSNLSIPLKTPFKTALRSVDRIEDLIVMIETDTGQIGYGEVPPTAAITGETKQSITGAIINHIRPRLIGRDIAYLEEIMAVLHGSIVANNSAKAGVDIAVYDLFGQLHQAPVYQLLGGYRSRLTTNLTISVNGVDEMVRDSLSAINRGYETLKIKVGKDWKKDLERLREIRQAVGPDILIRIDANQGWNHKEAIAILARMEEAELEIELVEQPVPAHDISGLKRVTDHTNIPVMADESVFNPRDALQIISTRSADLINIKLMKAGGIYRALQICSIAESYEVECMMGCMLESKISVNAAAHLAGAKRIITRVDLDGPALCLEDPVEGGSMFAESQITLSQTPGFGIQNIRGLTF